MRSQRYLNFSLDFGSRTSKSRVSRKGAKGAKNKFEARNSKFEKIQMTKLGKKSDSVFWIFEI